MKERPTIELVELMLTATVCLFLLLAGAGLTFLSVTQPEPAAVAARQPYGQALIGAITTILGALLGLVAGRKGTADPDSTPTRGQPDGDLRPPRA